MEGKVKNRRIRKAGMLLSILLLEILILTLASAQEGVQDKEAEAHLTLRKSSAERRYQDRVFEGEERVVSPGDSLWRILIEEKGLPEERFGLYLGIIGGLNPHIKNLNILPVGATLFIPARPDDVPGVSIADKNAVARLYRARPGDYLYKVLREQLGVKTLPEIREALKQVKDLNPEKKDWATLNAGETLLLPERKAARRDATMQPERPAVIVGSGFGKRLAARENLTLLEQVMESLGNELQRAGEESVSLRQGNARIDRKAYPVFYNPKTDRKVFLDLEEKISASLESELQGAGSRLSVVTIKPGVSLHDAVNQLLSRLGFEFLPSDRPVVVQEGAVGLRVQGDWMVIQPEKSDDGKIMAICLTDSNNRTPEYLQAYLATKGAILNEIVIPSKGSSSPARAVQNPYGEPDSSIQTWRGNNSELVDAILGHYKISPVNDHKISVAIREGIELDARVDRLFEFQGRRLALFFQPVPEDLKETLQKHERTVTVELDLRSLGRRELIARLLETLEKRSNYEEHRFSVMGGLNRDRLVVTIRGFYLPGQSLLITDGQIPDSLKRLFVEKGLRVVYYEP
ncbi:MAG: hypothetical protein HY695_03680 [Deltaproteobacteria bacterium]|nr:hypothetical protein [Deltaproteobacteria bacterium]